MQIRPYLIVSNLIEQPTWGGGYITRFKDFKNSLVSQLKIGQAYELYQASNLSAKLSTFDNPSLELGDQKQPENSRKITKEDKLIPISKLIEANPEKTLGKKYLKKFGRQIKTLVKFTQAKGNSYQIHVRKKADQWLPKPESWYYFEPGLITLGVKAGISWDDYMSVCKSIDRLAQTLSGQVKSGEMEIGQARRRLEEFIGKNNPEQFVNKIQIEKDQTIDLSAGGIHHSWEEDEIKLPEGNILYEVQLNVYDEVSTIRSFDKGKIKADGSIRKLQIDDYFKYIERGKTANRPKTHSIKTGVVKKSKSHEVRQIFTTPNYSMQEISFKGEYRDKASSSFHHLFVKEGKVDLESGNHCLTLGRGFSAFVPADNLGYRLTSGKQVTVLKTYL